MQVLWNIRWVLLASLLVNLAKLLFTIQCSQISCVSEVCRAVLRLSLLWCLKVFIENHVVIILGNEALESKMFCHEADQKRTWSVIGKFCWWLLFEFKHWVEENFAKSSSLYLSINIKVKNAKWVHLNQLVWSRANKQLFWPNFDKAYALTAFSLKVASMVVSTSFSKRRYYRWKALSLNTVNLNLTLTFADASPSRSITCVSWFVADEDFLSTYLMRRSSPLRTQTPFFRTVEAKFWSKLWTLKLNSI